MNMTTRSRCSSSAACTQASHDKSAWSQPTSHLYLLRLDCRDCRAAVLCRSLNSPASSLQRMQVLSPSSTALGAARLSSSPV